MTACGRLAVQPGGHVARPRVTVVGLGPSHCAGHLAVSVVHEPLRRAEHDAGRRALRAALCALDTSPGPLRRRPDGSPEAPQGTLVTISHRAPYAVAAAFRVRGHGLFGGPIGGLGVDIEPAGSVPAAGMHLICDADELRTLAAEPSWTDPTRLFVAKEALFKAIPCGVARFRPRSLRLRPLTRRSGLCVQHRGGSTTIGFVTTRRAVDQVLALCVALVEPGRRAIGEWEP